MSVEELLIRHATADDIKKIAEIEEKCFPPAEAASIKSFIERFMVFPECFYVAELEGNVVGHINGCVTDEPDLPDELYHNAALHKPKGDWQTVFGIAVLPDYQHQGIASAMMKYFQMQAKEQGRKGVILTCKDEKKTFYEGLGFLCKGVSNSCHGGAKWNDMLCEF